MLDQADAVRGQPIALPHRHASETCAGVAPFSRAKAYELRDGTRIWIITEADRSVTTILLLGEY